jgi:hypothetical protein
MGAAAYNRGSRLTSIAADAAMPLANKRTARAAQRDVESDLRAQVVRLEADLARARRCIAELRRSKDERMAEARVDAERSAFAISTLCRIAFPGDKETA